jgi:hypothetical protein
MKRIVLSAAAFVLAAAVYIHSASAEPSVARYLGDPPDNFADSEALVSAFKAGLEAKNIEELAKLIGLNPAEIGKSEGFDERLSEMQEAAKERLHVVDDGPDRRVILLGDLVWPIPFPVVKVDDRWQFDTTAGLEEILDRRIGENELEAIDTSRNYVLAQGLYHAEDRDDDGVLEYAQVLRSPEGTKDGLYWPASNGVESPAGNFVVEAKAEAAPEASDGYYGYRYRVLTKQGENIAGGAYDYVINGNMIAGFALVATPARYGETGIKTFLVSHHGKVYEKDLGSDSEAAAAQITTFNPDKTWTPVDD